jgi:hypothetical protein
VRFRVGPVPDDLEFDPQSDGWARLREPSFGRMMLFAIPFSFIMAAGLLLAWTRTSGFEFSVVIAPLALPGVVLGVSLVLLVHEMLHALALPDSRFTDATTLGWWPKAAMPYVAYRGELTRNRSVIVAVVPFLALSLVPLFVGACVSYAPSWLVAVSVINGFGSSGDLIGAFLLFIGVPSSGVVRNKGIGTWWRIPAEQALPANAGSR